MHPRPCTDAKLRLASMSCSCAVAGLLVRRTLPEASLATFEVSTPAKSSSADLDIAAYTDISTSA